MVNVGIAPQVFI